MASAIVLGLATGCIGGGITYPATHTTAVIDVLGNGIYATPLTPRCHETPLDRAPQIERCREGTKWAFVTLIIGIPLPVPYGRFRTFQEFEVRDGVLTQTERSLDSVGAVCGFLPVMSDLTPNFLTWKLTCM